MRGEPAVQPPAGALWRFQRSQAGSRYRALAGAVAFALFLFVSCDPETGKLRCGYGGPCDGPTNPVIASGVLTNTNTSITLVSSDAPKDCHARFEATFQWLDPERRKTSQMPNASFEFEVVGGGFFLAPEPSTRPRTKGRSGS